MGGNADISQESVVSVFCRGQWPPGLCFISLDAITLRQSVCCRKMEKGQGISSVPAKSARCSSVCWCEAYFSMCLLSLASFQFFSKLLLPAQQPFLLSYEQLFLWFSFKIMNSCLPPPFTFYRFHSYSVSLINHLNFGSI